MRKELEEFLNGLGPDELVQARRYIERLLTTLQQTPGLVRPAPEGAPEHRQSERYEVNLPITYFRHAAARRPHGTVTAQEGLVRDIARGGVRFFAAESLEPDEVLTLYLPRPVGVRKLFVEVRWAERRGGQIECGAAFVGLDRVFAAQKAEERRSEAVRLLLACEPCPERDALQSLVVKNGYTVHMANSVPEACSELEKTESTMLLASAAMLVSEGERLLKAAEGLAGKVLSIALVSASELDDPALAALRRCHDYIADTEHAQEVRLIIGRNAGRLLAAQARRAAP
jgi:hypothetical protein